jgi:OOP family OmpA-OmpF porin
MIRIFVSLLGFMFLSIAAAAEPDAAGCKDYFVTRLAGYRIWECDVKDFDSAVFAEGTNKETKVDGRIVTNFYQQPDDATPNSPALVRRNYENALKAAGWIVIYSDNDTLTEKQTKDGEERWAQLTGNGGSSYQLLLAQKAGMQQSVVSAGDMLTALNKDGHISLHINFDTGKATIKPDSKSIVDQVIALMKQNSQLNLSIEGHTDNVGATASNKTLSVARAQSVVSALVNAGVAQSRLSAAGFGQERPIADNNTEDGRAQNRRVDLVKK